MGKNKTSSDFDKLVYFLKRRYISWSQSISSIQDIMCDEYSLIINEIERIKKKIKK